MLIQFATFVAYWEELFITQASVLYRTASAKALKAPVLLTVRTSGLTSPSRWTYGHVTQTTL